MKGSTVALVLLGVAGAGAAVDFIVRRQQAAQAVSTTTPVLAKVAKPAPASPNAAQIAEQAVGAKLGIPLAQLGATAQKAPTWLKVAAFPIGATAVAQSLINHPTQTLKNAASTAVSDTKKVGSAIASAFSSHSFTADQKADYCRRFPPGSGGLTDPNFLGIKCP